MKVALDEKLYLCVGRKTLGTITTACISTQVLSMVLARQLHMCKDLLGVSDYTSSLAFFHCVMNVADVELTTGMHTTCTAPPLAFPQPSPTRSNIPQPQIEVIEVQFGVIIIIKFD